MFGHLERANSLAVQGQSGAGNANSVANSRLNCLRAGQLETLATRSGTNRENPWSDIQD